MILGYNWNEGIDYEKLLKSFERCGLQATNFGLAVKEINDMVCVYSLTTFKREAPSKSS